METKKWLGKTFTETEKCFYITPSIGVGGFDYGYNKGFYFFFYFLIFEFYIEFKIK